jgi:hypothetical protein
MPAPSNLLKFRPVLTLDQLRHIICLTGIKEDDMDVSIRRVLIPLLAKIEVGAINPAYKLSETHAIKQQEVLDRTRYENGAMSPAEEAAYESKILGV